MYSSSALSLGVARGTFMRRLQRSVISGEAIIKMHSIFNTTLLPASFCWGQVVLVEKNPPARCKSQVFDP